MIIIMMMMMKREKIKLSIVNLLLLLSFQSEKFILLLNNCFPLNKHLFGLRITADIWQKTIIGSEKKFFVELIFYQNGCFNNDKLVRHTHTHTHTLTHININRSSVTTTMMENFFFKKSLNELIISFLTICPHQQQPKWIIT